MIKVVDYSPEHLEKINLKEIHNGERPDVVNTYAVTYLDGDEVLAIFGGFFFLPGVYQLWGLVSPLVYKKKFVFHKTVKLMLSHFAEKNQVRRYQMSVRVGNAEGWHWAKSLGFYQEGIMKAYNTDGTDCWLFGRMVR